MRRRIAGWRRVPNGHFLLFQDVVPAFGIELCLIHDACHAVAQRCADPVGGAGHPTRVGRTPVDILRMQIQRIFSGCIVGIYRTVNMDRALWPTGSATGEVEEGHVFRVGGRNREFR